MRYRSSRCDRIWRSVSSETTIRRLQGTRRIRHRSAARWGLCGHPPSVQRIRVGAQRIRVGRPKRQAGPRSGMIGGHGLRDRLAHPLGPEVVPDLPSVPGTSGRRGGHGARPDGPGPGLEFRARRPDHRHGGLPGRPAGTGRAVDGCMSRWAAGHWPVVRATGLVAARR